MRSYDVTRKNIRPTFYLASFRIAAMKEKAERIVWSVLLKFHHDIYHISCVRFYTDISLA